MIKIVNAYDGMTVHYPLLLLKGSVGGYCGCSQITVNILDSTFEIFEIKSHLSARHFKTLTPLFHGTNELTVACSHHAVSLHLHYLRAGGGPYVRPVYMTFTGDDGKFQAPEDVDCSPLSACKRIGLAVRLLQSILAESIYAEVGIRRTFACAEDKIKPETPAPMIPTSTSSAAVWCVESSLSLSQCLKISPNELWTIVARDLVRSFPYDLPNTKWLVILSCARYKPLEASEPTPSTHEEILLHSSGHCALGADGLALFGPGTLYIWPESLDDLTTVLTNTEKVDRRRFMDDSAHRWTFWANYATSLGTMLHELGHCFDLDHTPEGIMRRGGDDANLVLAFPPPGIPTAQRPQLLIPPAGRLSVFQCSKRAFYEVMANGSMDHSLNGTTVWPADCDSVWQHGKAFWGRPVAEFLAHHRIRPSVSVPTYALEGLSPRWLLSTPPNLTTPATVSTIDFYRHIKADHGVRVVQVRLLTSCSLPKARIWNNLRSPSAKRINLPLEGEELLQGCIVYHRVWKSQPPRTVAIGSVIRQIFAVLRVPSLKLVVLDGAGQVFKTTLTPDLSQASPCSNCRTGAALPFRH